ncbi:MAG: molybdenum cofactor carrier protein [Gammaproteobacteria bacterium]|nr:molybdenum cofactor carrier protein [Gammaproteobacteria bacterium]
MPAPAERTVGVMGSSREEHAELAEPLGRLLARLGVNLLTGAGRGVMTAVSRAYTHADRDRGVCIGIVPAASEAERGHPKPGYPNPFVEVAIYTHLPKSGAAGREDLSRNHINVLTSDVIIALPGSEGTASEVELALAYGKPVSAYAANDAQLSNLSARIERLYSIEAVEGFITSRFA